MHIRTVLMPVCDALYFYYHCRQAAPQPKKRNIVDVDADSDADEPPPAKLSRKLYITDASDARLPGNM